MADAQLTKVAAPDGEKDLFEHRISLDLTPENAVFTPSAGSLISLTLTQPSGEVEFFERVVPVRAFPISSRRNSSPSASRTPGWAGAAMSWA